MASQSQLEIFRNDWNQTAAWAQSKGIKYNDYFPIYQKDTQQLLQYGTRMSTAERERAITAAANPNQATQSTPSTASNPSNVIGNSITDLRNIFTGLGDIAIHPLNNGLTDSVKNTFDLIDGDHKLTGTTGDKLGQLLTGTVLSFLPGAADVGTILKAGSLDAGLELLAEHPIGSLLDLSGAFQPVRLAGLAGEDEAASLADRAGLSAQDAKHAGIIRTGKGLILNTKTSKIGQTGAGIGAMSIGDRLHAWTAGSMLNLNPDIADAAGGYEQTLNHYNNVKASKFTDWEEAKTHLDDSQKAQLETILSKAQKVGLDKAMQGVEDPRIIQAADAWLEVQHWETEEALNASDGLRKITNPRTGQENVYSLRSHPTVFAKRDVAIAAEDALMKSPQLAHMDQLATQTQQAGALFQKSTDGVRQANQAARQVQVEGNLTGEDAVTLPGNKRPTPFGKARIATEGTNSLFGTGGWVDRLVEKAQQGEYETVAQLADDTLKRLDKWSTTSVNAADDPAWQALRTQIDQLGKSAKAMVEIRKQTSREAHGAAKRWIGDKPHRDQIHKDEEDSLKKTQQTQRQKLRDRQKTFRDTLHKAYDLKRQEIRDRYAQSKIQRAGQIKNITQKYELEKGRAKTQNLLQRETFEEWRRGRSAQGLPASREYIQGAQEGVRIAPGAPGSPEALRAAETALELEKQREIALLPSEAELRARFQSELSTANRLETSMSQGAF